MNQEIDDMISMWRAIKMLSPFLLTLLSGVGACVVYYMREMSQSMKSVCEALVRVETHIQHHEERLDRLEDHCPLLRKDLPHGSP